MDENGHVCAHERFIIKHHSFTSSHGRSRPRKICKGEKSLAPHLLAFGRDDVNDLAICSEKCIKLYAQFFFVDFIVEIIDIESGIWLI